MHFDSVALKDLYFVDSQWLCDMFAHVVSSEFNCKLKLAISLRFSTYLYLVFYFNFCGYKYSFVV